MLKFQIPSHLESWDGRRPASKDECVAVTVAEAYQEARHRLVNFGRATEDQARGCKIEVKYIPHAPLYGVWEVEVDGLPDAVVEEFTEAHGLTR